MYRSSVQISTVIFDFGGVVIRWDPRHVYRDLLPHEEITRFFDEVGFHAWNEQQDRGRSWSEGVAELSSQFPHRADLIRAFDEKWEDSILGTIDGTVRIIERLHSNGIQLVGLTNWSADKFALTRPRYDVFNLMDTIVVSGEEGFMKPDRRIFDLALRRSGRRADECVFVDDSAPNVEAAQALGFHAVHFQSPEQLEKELQRHGLL